MHHAPQHTIHNAHFHSQFLCDLVHFDYHLLSYIAPYYAHLLEKKTPTIFVIIATIVRLMTFFGTTYWLTTLLPFVLHALYRDNCLPSFTSLLVVSRYTFLLETCSWEYIAQTYTIDAAINPEQKCYKNSVSEWWSVNWHITCCFKIVVYKSWASVVL